MSNQVYGNDTPQAANVYVSQLVRSNGAGGTVVNSLTIASAPSVTSNSSGYLVRDPVTGVVMTQDATSVPDTGFTLRSIDTGGQVVAALGVPALVLFAADGVPHAGVTYAAGVFTLVYSGVYTAAYHAAWGGAMILDVQASVWFELLSQGAVKFARSIAVTFPADSGPLGHTGSFSFIAEAGDELRVWAAQNDTITNTLLGIDSTPDITSVSITRISPFVPPA